MPIYVHVSEECIRDAQEHGLSSPLERLYDSVTDTQTLAGFREFPPSSFLRKSIGRHYRLLAYQASVSDDQLILFLRVLPRGDLDYESFLRNWRLNIKTMEEKFELPARNELEEIHARLSQTSPAKPLPSPSTEEQQWLNKIQPEGLFEKEGIILETANWIEKMKSPDNLPFMEKYREILSEIIENEGIHPFENNSAIQTRWDNNKEFGIVYQFRAEKRHILVESVRKSDDVQSLIKSHHEKMQQIKDEEDQLLRIAARSYPSLMVLDPEAWIAIQKDDEANLALSPEEADLLENIRNPLIDLGYPLFINGRAGSGKSTILQYLAADYVDFALRHSQEREDILYMTCSRDLLKRAKETVRQRLTAGYEGLFEGRRHSQRSIFNTLDRSFQVFHDFLRGLLPPEKQETLAEDFYVDYSTFQRLWKEGFGKSQKASQFSPDVSWHVIRSYIKGIRSEQSDDLAPEEFGVLPRQSQSVSVEFYKNIYSNVWKWYRDLCVEEGYWDDQDLASLVLEAGVCSNSSYTAIFCDEAQDFTPAELDVIFQLSVFSRRSLRPEQLRCVPFIFAGDPLQTINPTGFRWSAVTANFHERFSAVLEKRSPQMSYRELHFNYRSNPGIVKFCNLIQFLRAALDSNDQISHQKAWWIDDPAPVVWFIDDNDKTTEQLRQNPGFVKLVYCEDGEETDHVEQDTILQNALRDTKAEGVYPSVLGPARAKGLEFSSVVLFRFGEAAPDIFTRWIGGRANWADLNDSENRLPLEYFLNRLYVAASRAKNHLIIVDSQRAINNFWSFATAQDFPENLRKLMENPQDHKPWLSEVANIFPGEESSWRGEHIDLHEQAKTYAGQGRSNRDPYLMRQAGLAYRGAGQASDVDKCFALAEEFEGKYLEAGNRYIRIGEHEEAFRCYWKIGDWRRLITVVAQAPRLTQRLESRAADFMRSNGNPDRIFLDVLSSAAIVDRDWLNSACGDPTWRDVIAKIARQLSVASDTANEIPWAQVHEAFNRFVGKGVSIEDLHLAAIAYANGDFAKAVNLWERSDFGAFPRLLAEHDFAKAANLWERRGNAQTNKYYRAKAQVAPFPECLLFMDRCRDQSKVMDRWRSENLKPSAVEKTDKEVIRAVIDAALQLEDFQVAAELLHGHPDRRRATMLLTKSLQSKKNDSFALSGVTAIARALVKDGQWKDAIDAAKSVELLKLDPNALTKIRLLFERIDQKDAVLKAVVWELAVSESSEGQQTVQEFLRAKFIRRIGGRGTQAGRLPDNHNIPPNVIGAAIERARRIVDALQYYEGLMSAAAKKDVKKFAVERLIYNLELHADILKDEGKRQEQARRAESLRREFNIPVDVKIKKYPVIPVPQERDFLEKKIDAPESKKSSTEKRPSQIGPLKAVLSPRQDKLRIEHNDLFQTVTIDGQSREIRTGDVNVDELESPDEGAKVWKISEWQDTTISLLPEDKRLMVRIECEGQSREVRLAADSSVD